MPDTDPASPTLLRNLKRLRRRAGHGLSGPYPVLPRPVDALSEQWARLRPRARLLLAAGAVAALVLAVGARIERAERRWGGPGIAVLVAAEDLAVGAEKLAVERRTLPPAAVPPGALADVPADAVLALALPRGAVLTQAHLNPQGPSAALTPGFRAVPIPVEDGWGVTAGGWVDVWVMGADGEAVRQVAAARPVLTVGDDGGAGRTALVGLAGDEVGPVTEGLALGQVLLSHAPATDGA